MKVVNIIHILGGIGLLVLLNPKFFSEEIVRKWGLLFFFMGLMIGAYHVVKYTRNPQRWIYLFHALVVAPTVLMLGFYPQTVRQMLQLIACAMIAYHTAIIAKVL